MCPDQSPESDYYMRLLVDRVPTMLAYWDRQLRCRFVNRAYEAWFGVDPDQLLGTHIRDLLGPQLFAMNHPMMLKALAGERQVFERVIPGPGGVERHSLAEYIPDVVNGEVRGFLVQVTSVAELKETKEALRRESRLRAEIERNARQLEEVLAERTEMLNVLAHEVRQPLNNASAALQGAESSLDQRGGETVHLAGQVRQARAVIREVLAQIDNTLTVSALLARSGPVERDDVDVDTLLSIARCDLPPAERERVQVVRHTATRTAQMDMSLMRLALRNLLLNALSFSPAGSSIVIDVSDEADPPALHIAITDQGPGIPVELQPRLFTRGAHGKGTGRHGFGLGLYIVAKVMALHGGSAQLVRTGPGGTTISLTVPQVDGDDVKPPAAEP